MLAKSNADPSTINFSCPECSFQKRLDARAEGREAKCPSCGILVMIHSHSPPVVPLDPIAPVGQEIPVRKARGLTSKHKKILIAFSSIAVASLVFLSLFIFYPSSEPEGRRENAHVSWWDGSYPPLTKRIKEGMQDPSSFEHLSTMTSQTKEGESIYVRTDYSGKNSQGGTTKHSAIAWYHESGELEKMSQIDYPNKGTVFYDFDGNPNNN